MDAIHCTTRLRDCAKHTDSDLQEYTCPILIEMMYEKVSYTSTCYSTSKFCRMPVRTKRLQARTKRSWRWTQTAQVILWRNGCLQPITAPQLGIFRSFPRDENIGTFPRIGHVPGRQMWGCPMNGIFRKFNNGNGSMICVYLRHLQKLGPGSKKNPAWMEQLT